MCNYDPGALMTTGSPTQERIRRMHYEIEIKKYRSQYACAQPEILMHMYHGPESQGLRSRMSDSALHNLDVHRANLGSPMPR